MLTQLNPPLPVNTPKGAAWAVAVIDYGPDHDLRWVTFLHSSGECWTWHNADIRQPRNITNRTLIAPEPHGGSAPRFRPTKEAPLGNMGWRMTPDQRNALVDPPTNAHCPTRDLERAARDPAP